MQASPTTTDSPAKSAATCNVVGDTAATTHAVVDKAAATESSAVQKVNTAIDQAAESGHQAVTKAERAIAPAERWATEKTTAVLAAPKNAVADARKYIVTHPWQSVGTALLAGMLIGRATR